VFLLARTAKPSLIERVTVGSLVTPASMPLFLKAASISGKPI